MQDLPRTVDGKIARAADLKEQGNEQFKAKNYKKAIGHYMQIGLFLTGPPFSGGEAGGGMAGMFGGGGSSTQEKLTEEQQEAVDQLTFTANLNLSACYLKEEKYEKAAARATKVLEKDANHVKALFRRGEARIYLNDLERAREDLKAAEKLAPDDKGIKSRLSLLEKREKHFAKKEKQTYAKMFAPAKAAEASADSAQEEEPAEESGMAAGDGPAGGSGTGAGASAGETPAAMSDDGGGSAGSVEGAPSPTSSTSPGGGAAAAAQDPMVAEALARVAAEGQRAAAAAAEGEGGSGGGGDSTYKW